MKARIGIPRTLAYYTYFPLWKTFLENIGMDVIISPETNKEIVNQGARETVNDACVPVKVMHGHVLSLSQEVDYLFIPRMVCAEKHTTFCPKFLGLPDMVKHSIEGLPQIIDTNFDLSKGRRAVFKFFSQVAQQLSIGRLCAYTAGIRALHSLALFRKKLLNGLTPMVELAVEKIPDIITNNNLSDEKSLKIAVLGYPYLVYDPYISVNLIEKVISMGVTPLTIELVSEKELRQAAKKLPQRLFWYYSNRVVCSALHYLDKGVDGVVHVTAFGCGPDAMVGKLLELECKHKSMPFITVTVDEHSGEAGVQTRLEACIDMLQRKQDTQNGCSCIIGGKKVQNLVMSSSCLRREA